MLIESEESTFEGGGREEEFKAGFALSGAMNSGAPAGAPPSCTESTRFKDNPFRRAPLRLAR